MKPLRPLGLALALLTLLGACAPQGTPSGDAPAAQPVTLSYALPDDGASRAAAEALRASFAAAHPGVAIELRPLPAASYAQALDEQLAAGSGPDLFAHSAQQIPGLRQGGRLLDLAPLGVGTGELLPATTEPWRDGQKLYGLPQRADPTVLFYNRELFDEAGVAYPDPDDWDWASWRDTARRLSNQTRGQFGTALGGWLGLVWGNGGELFNADLSQTLLDRPEATDGIQFGADMVHLDRSAPIPQASGGPDALKLFREGKLAMLPAPSSLLADLQREPAGFAWDLAPMPVGARQVTVLAVSGLGASASTPNPEAAARFIAWATGAEGLGAYLKASPFAAVPLPSLMDLAPAAGVPEGAKYVVEALGYGRVTPFVAQTAQINEMVNTALRPVFEGKQTAATAYRQLAPEINQLLAAG
jgi:multiple sugar transport system substrate-binding protein